MPRTLGYHVVKSGYGLWLPGDDRGHWSEAWDDDLGLIEPGTLHAGDPVRLRMARERLAHPPVTLTPPMIRVIADTLAGLVTRSRGGLAIAAAAIERTHTHLLIPYTGRDIDHTVKWIADQTTKAIHRHTDHAGPVWCKGRWRTFVFEASHWNNTTAYIRRHNTRRGLPPDPFPFITPLTM